MRENCIDKIAIVLKSDGELKSYEQVTIMEVKGDFVKVMDRALDVHITTLSNLRILDE